MKNDKTKHRIYKNMTTELQPTGYEARVLQKWNRTRTGYFLDTRTLGILLHAYPRRTQIFEKKNRFLSFFSFGYVTKIDKSSESGRNMNFR
jgi:hypothetical protein